MARWQGVNATGAPNRPPGGSALVVGDYRIRPKYSWLPFSTPDRPKARRESQAAANLTGAVHARIDAILSGAFVGNAVGKTLCAIERVASGFLARELQRELGARRRGDRELGRDRRRAPSQQIFFTPGRRKNHD